MTISPGCSVMPFERWAICSAAVNIIFVGIRVLLERVVHPPTSWPDWSFSIVRTRAFRSSHRYKRDLPVHCLLVARNASRDTPQFFALHGFPIDFDSRATGNLRHHASLGI